MAKELSWIIESITEPDYDNVNETIKQVIPYISKDGDTPIALNRIFVRDNTESDAASKTAIKTELTDLGYSWDTEI